MARHWAEEVAKGFLESKGYVTLVSNYAIRGAEIDLIMRHGTDFVFIEVRQRKSTSYGAPEETINPKKIFRLRQAALYYVTKHYERDDLPMRFDVFLVLGTKDKYNIKHIKNAF